MSTSICWELTCNELASHPEGVKDSHPLNIMFNTTETRDKWVTGFMGHLAQKGFILSFSVYLRFLVFITYLGVYTLK